jgi:CRP-like cAMP-binding protein
MTDTLSPAERKTLVTKQKLFAQLNDEEIEMLVSLFQEKHFDSATTLVTEGEPVDSIFLIARGQADVRRAKLHEDVMQNHSVATLTEGMAIGISETGFYSLSGLRTATVIALTEMTVLYLSVARFNGFALAYPRVKEIINKGSTAAAASGSS